MKTNEAFPARETNPADLPNSKDKIKKWSKPLTLAMWRARSTAGQANEAWALYKSNLSRVTWDVLSSDLSR